MIRAVVVDVDDTLCLTEAVSFELENEVLHSLGRPPMDREAHLSNWGRPLLEAIAERSPGIDIDEFARAYPPVLRACVERGGIDVVDEANLKAIDALRDAGCDVLLLTSREEVEVAHFLADDHVLRGRVSAVFHADNTTHRKPDPRAFDVVLDHTGLRPRECVYVGDSPGDAVAAHGAGLRFVGCMEAGIRSRADFDPHKVDIFIERFPEIVDAVAELDRP